jgi:hypothetical protein
MTDEEDHLTQALGPVVCWLVLFSIIVHGLSIPALIALYRYKGVQPIVEENPAEVRDLSDNDALPANAYGKPKRNSVIVHNRLSRPISTSVGPELTGGTRTRVWRRSRRMRRGRPN